MAGTISVVIPCYNAAAFVGEAIASVLAQTRPGVQGALLFHGAIPISQFGGAWPKGVPLQIHMMDADELVLMLEYLRTGLTLTRRIGRGEVEEKARRLRARVTVAAEATAWPPTPGTLCDWCGFNDLCEAYTPRRAR